MFLKEFKDLRRKPELLLGLPDLLNYAFAEDQYTIINKDGARLRAFACYPPDLNSASAAELDAHRALANRAFARFDDGFAYQLDLMRFPNDEYPQRAFADPVSAMIDHEAALHYTQAGRHFESRWVISIACRRTSEIQNKFGETFISGKPGNSDHEREREWFDQQIQEFRDAVAPVLRLDPLGQSGLLSHFTSCINGRMCQVRAPRGPVPLDAVLGNQDFVPGFRPRVGGRHIRVIALSGFPQFSHAELATFLSELPLAYRYSIRAIPLGLRASVSQLGVHRRNWFQKRKGARAMLSESIGSGTGGAFENQHALRMASDADSAIAEAEGGEVRFCYVTAAIILTGDTAGEADEGARLVFKAAQNMSFDPRLETANANEAWLGSLPIHGWYNYASRWSAPATWSTSCR